MLSRSLLPENITLGIINNGNGDVEYLASEAHSAGFIVGIYTIKSSVGILKFADFVVKGNLNNFQQLMLFIERCNIITYTGTVVNDQFISCIRKVFGAPQGIGTLDLIHDRSIRHAFLNMNHIQSVPYRTIIDLDDIQRGVNSFGYPSVLKPIQTSTLNDRQLVIKHQVDISKAAGMLEVGTYILEPDLHDDDHFSILIIKSKNGSLEWLPIVETRYRNGQLIECNACPNLKIQVRQQLEAKAKQVAMHLYYVGGIEISLVYSKSHNVYVEGIQPPFNLVSDLFTFNGINVYQQYLRALIGKRVSSTRPHILGIVKRVDRVNYQKFQRLWLRYSDIYLHIDRNTRSGNVFIKTQRPKVTLKKLRD